MKIKKTATLLNSQDALAETVYIESYQHIKEAIRQIDWPPGTGKFTIFPQSGKRRGEGNGVKPIKVSFLEYLTRKGWETELQINAGTRQKFGGVDAVFTKDDQVVAVEWETGNVSSSHRSINKLAFFIQKEVILSGCVVVPCRSLARYLTDRIGNFEELEPYFDFWRNCLGCRQGVLEIIGIEYDDTSQEVPRIPKGTDGRAMS